MDKYRKVFWCFPWGYRESMVFSLGLLFCGIILDTTIGKPISSISYPYNLVGGIIFLFLLWVLFKSKRFGKIAFWLYSFQGAIASVCLFGLVSTAMALIPQNGKSTFFLYNLTSSYTYFLAYLFFLISLGMVILKRLIPFKLKNIGFLFSHFGLWLAMFAAGAGHGDMQRLTMYLQEGEIVWFAQDAEKNQVELPLAIKLHDFDIDEYNSKLAIIDNKTGEIVSKDGKPCINDMVKGKIINLLDYSLKIKKYYKYSMFVGGMFKPVIRKEAVSSALIEIADKNQWICSPGLKSMAKMLRLNDKHSLVLLKPGPKRYFSNVTIFEKDGDIRKATIQVNKPVNVKGWYIYQNSYDKALGKWSTTSILELVKDPWLNVVYIGCLLIILGAFDMIWRGRIRNLKTK